MTTAIDTDVFFALWDADPATNSAARIAVEAAYRRGNLIVAAPVFAELIAAPGRTESFVGAFFADTGIGVDWELGERVWRAAGNAFRSYADRRRKPHDWGARRILADFLSGAHAAERGYQLLTGDGRLYRVAFPSLKIQAI
jgi:predicted nucleic acid-binding protein